MSEDSVKPPKPTKPPPPVPKKSTKPPLPKPPAPKAPLPKPPQQPSTLMGLAPPPPPSEPEPKKPEAKPEPVVPPPTPSNAETLPLEGLSSKKAPSEPPPSGPIRSPLAPPAWHVRFRGWSKEQYAELKERTKDKPPWYLPAIGGGGALCLLILLLAGVKAACGSSGSSAQAATSSQTSSSSAAQSSATPAAPAPPMMCALAGDRRSIAPRALAASGVEVAVLGSEIAVGFASSPNDAKVEIVDPSTGATATSVLARSNDPIRRVIALSRTSATLDVDHKKDALHSRRTLISHLDADPPVDVGGTEDGFGWAPHKSDKPIKLWALPQSGVAVEQVRGDALADGKGFAIAFRQGSVVYAGAFGGTPPAPLGPLVHVDGLGTTGGAPVVAASGDRIMIAWSDRATPSEPWHLRTATFRVGDDAAQPHAFAAPPGGLGEQTMSPDLSSLGSGRFLLLWTEGLSSHQVRGAVLGEEGAPSSAFAVSPDGADAGQGQAAVLDDGRGVVAYLSATTPGFYEAISAPIKCVEKR